MKEVNQVLADPTNWQYWPEKALYDGPPHSDWKIFPFYADLAGGVWAEDNCQKTPTLTAFIKSLPGLKLATLSKLSPGMKLKPHRGWGNHSNYVLRCHYGLIVPCCSPQREKSCYIKVNDNIQYHGNDEWMVFDDSETHMAENRSDQDRLVLIIDLERPVHIPPGTSEVGDTKELNEIVEYFRQRQIK